MLRLTASSHFAHNSSCTSSDSIGSTTADTAAGRLGHCNTEVVAGTQGTVGKSVARPWGSELPVHLSRL